MAKTVCVLSPAEEANLFLGIQPDCKRHLHISKHDAQELSAHPDVDYSSAFKRIVIHDTRMWRVMESGMVGVWQWVSVRRRGTGKAVATQKKSKFPQLPQGRNGTPRVIHVEARA